jgi:hypothetical protein
MVMSKAEEFKEAQAIGLDKLLKDPVSYSSRYTIDTVYEAGYVAGMEMARRLLRLQLGLGVPGDSED